MDSKQDRIRKYCEYFLMEIRIQFLNSKKEKFIGRYRNRASIRKTKQSPAQWYNVGLPCARLWAQSKSLSCETKEKRWDLERGR
jgi:hypothetical protein